MNRSAHAYIKKCICVLLTFMVSNISSSDLTGLEILCPLGTDLLHEDLTRTELAAYTLLSSSDCTIAGHYLAVPWHGITLSVKGSSRALREALQGLSSQKIDGGFTVVYNLAWYKHVMLPLLDRIGVDVVFTPCATKSLRKYKNVRIEPFPYFAVHGTDPYPTKDILYGFIGLDSHRVRSVIFSMQHPKDTVIIDTQSWFSEQNRDTYKDILARSRFSLCPRGKEPGSIRFWESLQAGAIPVLISDDWRLPETFDWSSCVITIKESKVHTIPDVIAAISPEKELAMRAACLEAHKQFSGDNFISVIEEYYRQTHLK